MQTTITPPCLTSFNQFMGFWAFLIFIVDILLVFQLDSGEFGVSVDFADVFTVFIRGKLKLDKFFETENP